MNEHMVRIGVIGCGVIGIEHLTAASASPWVDIAAVCDLREEAARMAAERFGVSTVYTEPRALIADPRVDAVVLATPTKGRAELAKLAFAEGKHVLLEKPAAMNPAELEELIEAQGALTAACCSSRFRFLPHAKAATAFFAGGALGELRVVRARGMKPLGPPPSGPVPAWRYSMAMNGGGILSNWGSYDLDYLFGIAGWTLKPTSVLAGTWTVPPELEHHVAPGSDAETHGIALVQCEGGAVLSLERGEYVPVSDNSWELIGSKGALVMRMTPDEERNQVIFRLADPHEGVREQVIYEGAENWETIHWGPLQDFTKAILERRRPMTDLQQALVILRTTHAIYDSASRRTAVDLTRSM